MARRACETEGGLTVKGFVGALIQFQTRLPPLTHSAFKLSR